MVLCVVFDSSCTVDPKGACLGCGSGPLIRFCSIGSGLMDGVCGFVFRRLELWVPRSQKPLFHIS